MILADSSIAHLPRHRNRFKFLKSRTEILGLLTLSYRLEPWQ